MVANEEDHSAKTARARDQFFNGGDAPDGLVS